MASVFVYLVCTADRYELPLAECPTMAQAAAYIGVSPGAVRINLYRQRQGMRQRVGVRHKDGAIACYVERVPLETGQLSLFGDAS